MKLPLPLFALRLSSVLNLGLLVATTGCLSGRPGIAIVNLETGQQHVRSARGTFDEEPLDVNETTGTFRTLQRSETNSLLLRTVDFEGRTKAETVLPIFDRVLEGYGSTWTYAISPDGGRVAYLDGKSQELRLFDFKARQYEVLATNITSSSVHVVFVFWLPDGRLLIGAHVPEKAAHDKILIIDPHSRSVELIAQPRALGSFKNVLSPSKRYLAYWEGLDRSSLQGQFILHDLASRCQVGTLKSLSGEWLSQPHWSPDERQLAYMEGTRQIMVYSLTDQSSYVIGQLNPQQLTRLYAFAAGQILYKDYDPKRNDLINRPVRVRKTLNGKEHEIPDFRINGPVLVIDNGRRLIAKVGF